MAQGNLGKVAGLLLALLASAACNAGAQVAADSAQRVPIIVDGLGRGTFALGGRWEFHTGDDMAWAAPGFDDSSWEQIDISRPWGDQGHWAYAGYAWYRRQIDFRAEPGAAAEVWLFVPDALCAYEVYWNGKLIGRTGRPFPLPPEVDVIPPAVFRLGVAERGVLAFRALTRVNDTTINGDEVGLVNVPRLGNGEAIGNLAAQMRAKSLKRESMDIAEMVIYAQLFLVGAVVWARNRERKLLFWMAVFFLSAALWVGLKNPAIFPGLASSEAASGDEFHTLEDVAMWFLLLYLLELDRFPQLVRLTRVLAVVSLACATLDFAFLVYGWSPSQIRTEQLLDALVTVGFALPQIYPLVLIPFAFRQRMDPARRIMAVAAFLSDMYFVVWHTSIQGRRFTHWTLGDTMMRPVLTVDGVAISMPPILSLLLVCSIVYAVYRYTVEQSQRQTALQQEFQNARELQQVLIPESLPAIPGFALTSAYKPALEVGGDFFQIIPLQGGETMIVLGDVSGKGLKAAMAVSLIVGLVRALAPLLPDPGKLLTEVNDRLAGRLQGGFATAIALRLDARGQCDLACAGHLPPLLNGRELELPGAFPLGVAGGVQYESSRSHLRVSDRVALFTDGLLEARNASGELYGFKRMEELFTGNPTASEAAQAAVDFGQDDDITVIVLMRLGIESEAHAPGSAAVLVSA